MWCDWTAGRLQPGTWQRPRSRSITRRRFGGALEEELTLDEVLALHADQLARYGGAPGVRDLGLLESALAAPRATFGGKLLHGSVPEQAAAYLFHVAQNHPFLDGNKRAALASALAFLGLNGLWLEADPDELTELVLGVARGEVTKAGAAEFIRLHAVPLER